MFNKKLFLIGSLAVILVALFLAAGTAMATGTPCGESSFSPIPGGLTVKKVVACEIIRDWDWTISKSADQTSLTLSPGQTFPVNYDVIASAQATGSYKINGDIYVTNTSPGPITVASVTDILAPVSCPGLPATIAPGATLVCTYASTLSEAAPVNTATAITIGGVSYTSKPASIDWSLATVTETDECATISDTYTDFPGLPATVCANGQTTFTFEYSRQIGPFEACGEYTVENVASFVTNDTGATGSDNATVNVNVPCAAGCSLTPGYWKTHSAYGPAPYDDTWALLPNGADTPFYISGQTYYQVLWTNPRGGNAYYILAHQFIAAKLNLLNGASSTPQVNAALAWAGTFFATNTPTTALSKTVRNAALGYAFTLDQYNNGYTGPGHCSDNDVKRTSLLLYFDQFIALPFVKR
jgi:hypothetical protein